MPSGGCRKKVLMLGAKKEVVSYWKRRFGLSIRKGCWLVHLNRSTYNYEKKKEATENQMLRKRIRELASKRPRFGSPRLHVLLKREGWQVNHKRVERIWKEEGLKVPRKQPKKEDYT